MKRALSVISVIFIILFLLFGNTTYAVSMQNLLAEAKLISNQNNEFLLLTYNEDIFEIYKISENGAKKTANEKFSVKSYFFAGENLYVVHQNNRNLSLVKAGNNGTVEDAGIISDISLKDNCITATKNGYIYLTDSKTPKKIYKYTLDGIQLGEYALNENVGSLFTYKSDIETVYAITDNGIVSVEDNNFINCSIPESEFVFFNNYCCDKNGNVFIFSKESGFEKIMHTDYENLCVFKDIVYGTKENTVYMLNDNGVPTSECILDYNIQCLNVSGSNMAVLCDNNIYFLYKDDFKDCYEEISENINISSLNEESDNQNSYDISSNPDETENENSDIQTANYSISSDEYTFSDDIIIGVSQGTTIAKFKSNVNYYSNTVKFTDHNGKIKTSGQLGTGWKVDFLSKNKTVSYYIIISGDVTGEGNINSRDITALSDYLLEKSELSKYELYAADINNDNTVNSPDLLIMYKMIK